MARPAFESLTAHQEEVARQVVDAAYTVHVALGPGLLESIYETCFCHELSKRSLPWARQVTLPIVYDGICFDEGLRLDVLVADEVVCELKAAERPHPVWAAQVKSYLALTGKRLGFVLNFNVPKMKDGIERIIL